MKTRHWFATSLWLLLTVGGATPPKSLWAKAAMDALLPKFEAQTGNTVKATFGFGIGKRFKQAAQGTFDVSIAQPPFPDVLSSADVDVKSQTPVSAVSRSR